MEWLAVAVVGAIIGFVVSFAAAQAFRMPGSLVVFIGVMGALGGGMIQRATDTIIFGRWTFYIAGAALSIALLAGALLAYSLTNEERRV
jgi:uncharacterized membrane protein YeaQ/YmgE (transglycosylase-associated protein family)